MIILYITVICLSSNKSLGKIFLDKLGVTKSNIVKVDVIPTFKNEKEFNRLVQKIEELDKDPVQVDIYLKKHGLDKVENLKDYILNNDIQQGSVNELINTQNYTNIADQAHGFSGVNAAINEYNRLVQEGSADTGKFVEAISQSNSALGKHLSKFKQADGVF